MTTTAAGWVRSLHAFALSRGLDADALFAAAGIEMGALAGSHARVAQDKLNRLWDGLVEVTGNPGIGLQFGRQVTPASFGAVGFLMLSCGTVREAAEQCLRYQRYLAEAMRAELCDGDGVVELRLENVGGRSGVRVAVVEAMLAAVTAWLRWVLPEPVPPLRIQLRHAATVPLEEYEALFGCPVRAGSDHTAVVFASALMQRPLSGHDPWMQEQHRRLLETLQQEALQPWTGRVRQLMRQLLGVGPVEQGAVAAMLHLTPKTLQRRLEQEGTAFRPLLDEVRFELAREYLRQPAVALQEVSALCGYSDYSAFAKAFRQWSGRSPGDWRGHPG